MILVIATAVCGCATGDADGSKPKGVTETGYLTCVPDDSACPDAVKCTDAAGADTCVPYQDGCNEATCACLAAIACGEESCSDDPNGGITCVSEPDNTDTTGTDPNTDDTTGTDPNTGDTGDDTGTDPNTGDTGADTGDDTGTDPNTGDTGDDTGTDPNTGDTGDDTGTDPNTGDTGTDPVDTDADGTPDDEDCAPEDASIHPKADEVCNGVDDNCDGQIDDGCPDPNTDAWLTAGGTSFGFCAGACKRDVTIAEDGAVHMIASGHDDTIYADNKGVLTKTGQIAVMGIAGDLLGVSLDGVYGCPDCADGGAAQVVLKRQGKLSKHVYEFGNPPAELTAADDFVKDLLADMASCTETENVAPDADCVPYAP